MQIRKKRPFTGCRAKPIRPRKGEQRKMTSAKAKFLIDLCVAISFIAVSAGRYVASLADLPDEED